MSAPVDIQTLHATLASTLAPYGDQFRQAEAQLSVLEQQPQYITGLLTLVVEPTVDAGVRRAAAVSLKNKIVRAWGANPTHAISDADKAVFKQQLVPALVVVPPGLSEFLLVCVSAVLSYDYQVGRWPEFVPEVLGLLQATASLPSVMAGMKALKQLCKFYRWNTMETNKQLAPLMAQAFPLVLVVAEAALRHISDNPTGQALDTYYGLIYEALKIYKLASSRYLPPVFREPDTANRTVSLLCAVFMLPWPQAVLAVQPPSERTGLLPVKCLKWATTNLVRTHKLYLTKSYTQLSENAAQYAPFRELSLKTFAPEITRLFIERLQKWSASAGAGEAAVGHEHDGPYWLSEKALYNIVTYLDAMIEQKAVFTAHIEPHLPGLLGQVFYPLMAPHIEDFEEFEDDPNEFVQRRVNFNDMMLTSGYAATEFIRTVVKKRKNTLDPVVQFLQQCAEQTRQSDAKHGDLTQDVSAVKNRVALFNLVQALAPTFLNKGSVLYSQLEPFMALFLVPGLSSANAYVRYEACNTTTKLGTVKFESRDTLQQLFQGVLNCFFDGENLPVQVAAAQTLESLSLQAHNEDIISALGGHITEVVRNLLAIMEKIDLEALLEVLDHFVNQFPTQITPFATDLAAQLTRQFIVLAADLTEAQRQFAEDGGLDNRVVESELMMATDEKVAAGLGILTSITNLQNNLEHQRELTIKLDETMSPVFATVYDKELSDFYPDCMAMHENTLFTMKFVPPYHWQFFDGLLKLVTNTELDYFEEAMPVFENYIVYGAAGLAAAPERLQGFVRLLVRLYGPPAPGTPVYDYGESTAYSEAKSRIQVLTVATKLLVSSELFNGPLLPLIPSLVETVLNRVGYDSQQEKSQMFPPRYNVGMVSVVLGAIYHDPQTTLAVLQQSGAVDSFFQTWLATIPEFTRINDLKLAMMAILSLLSYQAAHPEFEIPRFTEVLGALTHILDALPGAAARLAELMKQENEDNLFDDDDLDEYDEEYEDESEAEGENDAGAEFDREVGGIGDGQFMYENPAGGNASGANTADASATQEEEEVDKEAVLQLRQALSSQMGFVADDYEQEIYSASPLDNLNAYDALRSVVYGVRSSQPSLYERMLAVLPEHGKVVLDESLQRESLPKYTF